MKSKSEREAQKTAVQKFVENRNEAIDERRRGKKRRATDRYNRISKKRAAMAATIAIVMVAIGSNAWGRDAMREINWRRTHSGLPAFRPDARLQAAAERSAQHQARMGRMSHQNHIGDHSGVGMSSDSRGPRAFHTCYAFQRGTAYAGAAAVQGRNGNWYYALDLRRSPSQGRRGRVCPRCHKVH